MGHIDAIVLGAGGMGSAAAYYLSKAGQRVLLLEQFELDHDRGSSYGDSRVIRAAYDHPVYIDLVRAAYPLWAALEEEAGETLYIQTGGLDIGFPDQPSFQMLKASLERADQPYEQLSLGELGDRFPQFHLDRGMQAIYSQATGMLAASKCVRAQTRLARAHGAMLIDRTPVLKICPAADRIDVFTARETYQAERLVITAGSWSKRLLAELGVELPLTIMPCQLAYFEATPAELYRPDRFPAFLFHLNIAAGEMPYGLPTPEGTGIKLSTFYGWSTVEHPSQVDYSPSGEWVEQMRQFLGNYLPGANGRLQSTRRCLYTLTPDKHFVIDRHPAYSHIAFAAGFSGHGFKFSTLVGSILTDLLLKGETAHDLSLFRLDRFQSST